MKYIKVNDLQEIENAFKTALYDFRGTGSFNFNYTQPKPDVHRTPEVAMTMNSYVKMSSYVHRYDKEIAWYGTVERHSDLFIIKDVFLHPQIVTSVTVETDQDKTNVFFNELDSNVLNSMRFQGHSHVNMHTSPSGTDNKFYSDTINVLPEDDFYIFLIMNKKNELWINIYDLSTNILFEKDDILFTVIDEDGDDILSKVDSEILENVEVIKPVTPSHNYGKSYNNGVTIYDSYAEYDEWMNDIYGATKRKKRGKK